MTSYYVDTSALIKRYLEVGSSWIKNMADSVSGNVIVVCDLTAVEVFSSLARRRREGTIAPADGLV